MTGLQKLLFGLACAVVVTLGTVATVSAHTGHGHDQTDITKGQVVNQTLFVSGEKISMDGEVEGDMFCIGQDVVISGRVQGDVICAAQRISITGTVEGSVRVAAQDITLGGSIGRSLAAAGEVVRLERDSRVARDASVAATRLTTLGTVGRDLYTAVDSINQQGKVGRDTVTRQDPATRDMPVALRILGGLSLLVMALLLTWLAPRLLRKGGDLLYDRPARVVLTGLVVSFAVPVAVFVLMVSVIGIPLAILLLAAWLVVLLLSAPFVAYGLGRILLRGHTKNDLVYALAGAAVLLLLYNLPVANVLTFFAVIWAGSGMLLLMLWSWRGALRRV